MCVSLDEPEPVGSVLTFPSGYDTLEYSWVKATAVSVRLRILFVTLQNTNKISGAVAGERVTPRPTDSTGEFEDCSDEVEELCRSEFRIAAMLIGPVKVE